MLKTLLIAVSIFAFTATPSLAKSSCGIASWYGPGFHGRTTASGQRFNQNAMTAAHKQIRFGTKVRVTNRKTGRSIVVKINDRGPFIKGRIIDLSKQAAKSLKIGGTANVCIRY